MKRTPWVPANGQNTLQESAVMAATDSLEPIASISPIDGTALGTLPATAPDAVAAIVDELAPQAKQEVERSLAE